MAEKLGLGPEVRELKIGDSFSSNKIAFHTLRYDFKPASVVSASKHASIEVGSNNQITVTHLETAGAPQTVFKGSQRPYHKECVLIIDHVTGEITLEKLATNIQLKKTRQEPQSRPSSNSHGRPPTPVDKKPSPPGRSHRGGSSAAVGGSRNGGGAIARHSPLHASPSYPTRSPVRPPSTASSASGHHKSPPQVHITASSPNPVAGSLPILDDLNDNSSSSFDISNTLNLPEIKTSPDFSGINLNDDDGTPEVGILTDSSSSSSSESNSSDSESEPEKPRPKPMNGHVNGKSSPSLTSMPELLNEDLQLSESGSDSD